MNQPTSNASNPLGRWTLAALVAGLGYVLTYIFEYTPFLYFPMVGEFHLSSQPPAMGPGITYFGWKTVGLAAGLLTLLIPARWTARIPADTLWVGAIALIITVCVHESRWFFH